jgi:hypothetical protein
MRVRVGPRFWVELVAAACSGALALVTLVWRDWIEVLVRVDPDHHSGALEWFTVAALIVICTANAVLARHDWNRAAVADSGLSAG